MEKDASSFEEIEFVRNFSFEYGVPSEIAPGVLRVIAKNPGPFTYTGSGTYIISAPDGRGSSAIIDPGPDISDHINAIVEAAGEISHIFVTHTHADHCGAARNLQKKCNAKIYGYGPHPQEISGEDAPALEEGGDMSFKPDIELRDGDVIKGKGWEIESVWTPGHISNHLCFALKGEKILFTGDHIMGWATTVIIPPDGSMKEYFSSLDKVLDRDETLYLPTHGAPITKPHRFTRAVKAHRKMRDGQILHQLGEGLETIPEIVAVMYADIDKRLHGAAALNVFAHLIGLCMDEKVSCNGSPALDSRYNKI